MKGFFTKIVGVTFENNDGSSRQKLLEELSTQWNPKSKILLQAKREKNNPFDPKAVAIYNPEGKQLGYLSKKVNETVAPWLDEGFQVLVEVTTINGGDDNHWGCNVYIEKSRTKTAPALF